MTNIVKDRISRVLEANKFKIFKYVLKKYNVDFYYKDKLGILTKRNFNDNFEYIFKTRNSCDALPLMLALDDKIKNSKIGIDVGANIGVVTIWMSRNCKKVYSFEPEKSNIERFIENIDINNVQNVQLIEKAVSDQEGEAELNILEGYGHHSLGNVKTSKKIGTQQVPVTTLDTFCEENNIKCIDFLKIDVEGFELEVCNGAKQLFKNKQIKMVAFEISEVPLKSIGRDGDQLYDFFKKVNYDVYYMNGTKFDKQNFKNISHLDLVAKPKY